MPKPNLASLFEAFVSRQFLKYRLAGHYLSSTDHFEQTDHFLLLKLSSNDIGRQSHTYQHYSTSLESSHNQYKYNADLHVSNNLSPHPTQPLNDGS